MITHDTLDPNPKDPENQPKALQCLLKSPRSWFTVCLNDTELVDAALEH